MMRKVGLLFLALVFLVTVSALAQPAKKEAPAAQPAAKAAPAATKAAPVAQGPKKGGTLIYGRGGDSVGLDPAYETDGNSFMVCDNIYEALVFYKDESTDVEPGLATSWDISPDGKTYTFKLRKGVKFHDGTPFTADAVVFSIGRMMKNPASSSSARDGRSRNRSAPLSTGSPWKWMTRWTPLRPQMNSRSCSN